MPVTRACPFPAYGKPVATERLRVSGSCVIALDELEWRFSGSGGPGGQHANTANTRVDLRFDIEASRSLGPRQKARLLERFGPVVRVVVSDSRSQHRNRELALERLAARLASGLRVEEPRKPTKVKRSAKEKRLRDKRQQAERKRGRARPTEESA
jgi:ribosome-associated protein